MKGIKKIAVVSLAFFFVFSPLNFRGIGEAVRNAKANEEIVGPVTWTESRTITEEVIVRPGSRLTIKKGVTITFDGGELLSDSGLITIEGTVKEPVKFKNAGGGNRYFVKISNGGALLAKNFDISGGGGVPIPDPEPGDGGGDGGGGQQGLNVFNRAWAAGEYAALNVIDYGSVYCDNCNFHDNIGGLLVSNIDSDSEFQINRSKFVGNDSFDVKYDDEFTLDFKYNWWGSSSGPDSQKISGNIDTADFSKRENFHDPVIIVPGIMGSWEKDGTWQIDPIFHTYDNLYAEFAANGYVPEENLFTFPYEWRNSNADNAEKLKTKIDDILSQAHWPQVDIVAHSMGGLLAEKYIEDNFDWNSYIFPSKVDQLITVGTPQLGAPESYVKWEAGESFWGFFDMVAKRIFQHEAEENGYADVFQYIRKRPMSSVQELLPIYNYLYDVDHDSALRESYPEEYPRNEFLEKLNDPSDDNLWPLEYVEFTKIIGRVDESESTVSGYNVIKSDMGDYWLDGYPHGSEIPWVGDQGLRWSEGDRTVPLYSAESFDIPADYTIPLESEHNALPTDAQKDILETLTGIIPSSEVKQGLIHDILFTAVYSPVDIQIESPDGKITGKNSQTGEIFQNIPGSFYGAEDKKLCENNPEKSCNIRGEFITIPNPEENKKYKILLQGTGEGGAYKIETTRIVEDESNPENVKESTAPPIEGVIAPNQQDQKNIEIKNGELVISDQPKDSTPPAITITSPENQKTYLNDQYALPVDYTITDDVSQIDKITKTIEYDGQLFAGSQIDLSLQKLGGHSFKITAIDGAGNKSEQLIAFRVTTSLNAIQNNLNHYSDLKLVKNKVAKEYFSARLKNLENIFKLLEEVKKSNLKPKLKQIAVNALKTVINADISLLVKQINSKYPRWIDQGAANFLIEDLNSLRP